MYSEFQAEVPMPDYVRRDGVMNVSAYFPLNANPPDLGTFSNTVHLF
jgi:lysine-specific demethylase 3